ncbi:hypothetical protein [Clostridium ljungdahlii]|uniref:Uncharacterized protein n=1 Tax=Clostridium ljungdahlii TaxID=1538 RepID=A0A162KNG0_9CLOT|nr:hypothetical protein [Clostridium ljungdahlii]OAA84682.1 hypothetical protein WY13_02581 [Clostridium ljungdahlii]
MNFEKDLREQIIESFKKGKIRFHEQDSTDKLLINYLNALNRTITIKKRNVFISDNIKKIIYYNKLDKKYINALLKFKNNFENGIDMNGHLSANIYYADLFSNKDNKIYNKSRDYLLDDWGIYHIHLNEKDAGNEKQMHGKTNGNRSKYLLFVKVTNNEVYFIDILYHNEKNVFSRMELVETLDRNWHFLLENNLQPKTFVPKLNDKEINDKRKKGDYLLYNINGKTYIPIGGGLTSAGTNIVHTMKADNILEDMIDIEKYFRNSYGSIKKDVENITGAKCFSKSLEFKFVLEERGYVVKESNTGYAVLYFYEGNNLMKRAGIIKDKC